MSVKAKSKGYSNTVGRGARVGWVWWGLFFLLTALVAYTCIYKCHLCSVMHVLSLLVVLSEQSSLISCSNVENNMPSTRIIHVT